MKKTVLTIAIALMMGTAAFAQQGDGGALRRSKQYERARTENNMRGEGSLVLPGEHGLSEDAQGNEGPLGSGVAVLLGLGAAYLVGKKRQED